MFWLTLIYFYNTWQGSSEAERKAGVLQEQFPASPAPGRPNPDWAPTPRIRVGTAWSRDAPPENWEHGGMDVDPPSASHPACCRLH